MATSVNDILNQVLGPAQPDPAQVIPAYQPPVPEQKKQAVAQASQQKQAQLGPLTPKNNPVSAYTLAAIGAHDGGRSLLTDQRQRDYATMNQADLLAKYGADVLALDNQNAQGESEYRADSVLPGSRSLSSDRIKDVSIGVAQGAANSALGIPALGLGLVSDRAGTWAARKLGDLNNWAESGKSDAHLVKSRMYSTHQELDQADNNERYQKDRASDGEFVASLKRIGRDTASTLGNVWDSPEMLQDTVGQGVGSLVTGGPIAKGLKVIGKAVLKGAVKAGVVGEAGAVAGRISRAGSASAMPATIGAMEAGGAYQSTVLDADQELAGRADLTQEQKNAMANGAGLTAAAIQFPFAAATGTLVSKFEGNLHTPNLKTFASNALKETIEESSQSATGQLAQNYGVQRDVNTSRDLSEGVGEQTALGAVGGFGSAVLVGAPGATRSSLKAAGSLASRADLAATRGIVNGVSGIIDRRSTAARDVIESASPVAPEIVNARVSEASQVAPEIHAEASQAIQSNPDTTPEQKSNAQQGMDRLLSLVNFDQSEADNQPNTAVRDALSGSSTRIEALNRAAALALNDDASDQDRLAAGLFIGENAQARGSIYNETADVFEALPDDHPVAARVQEFEDTIGQLDQHAGIQKALKAALDRVGSITPDTVSDENIDTPEGQQAAQTAVQLASYAPEKSNPEVNNSILLHAEQGKIDLSPEQRGFLQAANGLQQVERDYVEQVKRQGLTNTQVVSKLIQTDDNDPDTLHKSGKAHMDGIIAAVRDGNEPLASRRLQQFVNFAQSMQNKLTAFNQNLDNHQGQGNDGNASTSYQAYNPRTSEFFESKTPVWLVGRNQKSVGLAQQVAADAHAVGQLANNLTESFPQLGIKPIELGALHPAFGQTNAREAARDFHKASRDGTLDQLLNQGKLPLDGIKTPEQVVNQTTEDDAREFERKSNEERASRTDPRPTPAPTEAPRPGTSDESLPSDQAKKRDPGQPDVSPREPAPEVEATRKDAPVLPDKIPNKAVEARPSPDPVQPNPSTRRPGSVAPGEAGPAPEGTGDGVDHGVDARSAGDTRQTDERASREPERKGVDAAYPDLLGSTGEKVKSLFKQAFSLPKSPVSRLTGSDTEGVSMVREALSSKEDLQRLTGSEKTASKLKPEIARAYSIYLKQAGLIGRQMNTQLRQALDVKGKDGRTLEVFMTDAENGGLLDAVRTRTTAITEVDQATGKITYNSELLQGATLAALQWMLGMDQRSRVLRAEDVAKILGHNDETLVSNEQIRKFNQGVYSGDAIIDLSQAITRFWGVNTQRDAPIGFTRGIPEGVAKEVIVALHGLGLVKINPIQENGKTYYQLSLELKKNKQFVEDVYPQLIRMPNAIEAAVLTEPQDATFVDSVPPKRAATQLRNRNVPLTAKQVRMRANEEKTPHYVNLPTMNLFRALGSELFTHVLVDDKMNAQHRESLDSVNKGVAAAFEMAERTMAEVENVAGDRELDQVPIRYSYDVTSVGRLQMNGRQNPQANKITRELIMPTRSTLDLSDRSGRDMGLFMLGLAQAWGIKVHKQGRADSIAQVEKLVSGKYGPMLTALQEWSGKGKATQAIEGRELIDLIRSTFDPAGSSPPAPAAVHAAVEYARLMAAEDRSKFTTSVYVEADGVTDGPINAMVHMARGLFTKSWLATVRKGGLFIGQPGMTVNRFSQTTEGRSDLYQQTTDYLKDFQAEFKKSIENNKPLSRQLRAVEKLMEHLQFNLKVNSQGDLELDANGDPIVDRGAVKNPLTVKIYGAADKGISNKITSLLVKAIYERESAILQDPTNQDLLAYRPALAQLADTRVVKIQGSTSIEQTPTGDLFPKGDKNNKGAEAANRYARWKKLGNVGPDFALSAAQVSNISENVLQLYMKPMSDAISRSIGETDQSVKLIQQTTQVMSLVFRDAYQRAIQERLDAKQAATTPDEWKRNHFLSEDELQEVYESVKHLAPYIQTGDQNILVGAGDRMMLRTSENAKRDGSKTDVEFSRSLTSAGLEDGTRSNLSTPGYTNAPGEAGVSGIPYTVIATGDGQMMLTYSADHGGAGAKHLLIFDGANFSLDQLEQGSRDINQSVHEGWMRNPFGDVARAYSEFMSKTSDIRINPDLLKQLGRALGLKTVTEAAVRSGMADLREMTQQVSDEIEARKAVLARVGMSVDHMASAESPFDARGTEDLAGLTDDQILDRMNGMIEEYNKTEPVKNESKADINTAAPVNAVSVTGNDLLQVVRLNTAGRPEAERSFAQRLARRMSDEGYSLTMGTIQELAATLKTQTGQDVPLSGSRTKGFFSSNTKSIYVATDTNTLAETTIHEMIHAATVSQVQDFYRNQGENLSQPQREAIGRIEALMNEWLELTRDNVTSQATYDARQAVLAHVNDESNSTAARKTNALSEFMAWNLSNQDLIKQGKQTEVISTLARISRSVLDALRSLVQSLGIGAPGDTLYSNLRFNAEILLREPPSVANQVKETLLYHSTTFGENDRITQARQQLHDKVLRYLNEQPNAAARSTAESSGREAKAMSTNVSAAFEAAGFLRNMLEKGTFEMLVQAYAMDIRLDPNSMSRAQELYNHVVKQLTAESFMLNDGTNEQADRFQAQEKYNVLMGVDSMSVDAQDRSTLLPAFLALHLVDDQFRDVVSKIGLPDSEKSPNDSMDNVLTNVATEVMDRLGEIMAGQERNTPSVGAAIDQMTQRMLDVSRDEKSWIVQFGNRAGDIANAANTWVTDQFDRLSKAGQNKLDQIDQNNDNAAVKTLTGTARLALGLVDEELASANAEVLNQVANKALGKFNRNNLLKPFTEMAAEMVGRTSSNADVYDMIKNVRSMVAAIRQRYRDNLPKIIAKAFSRELTDGEWTHLYDGLGKTDIASLTSGYSVDQIIGMLGDPARVSSEVRTLQGRVASNTNGQLLITKARQLAEYMNTGRTTHNLLRNAHAIERLAGEEVRVSGEVDAGLVKDLDHLVSLYALEGLNQKARDNLSSLVQDENNGTRFVLSYLNGQRQTELEGIESRGDRALLNHYKGYVPSIQDGTSTGRSLVVANDSEYLRLREMGYQRVAPYQGAQGDGSVNARQRKSYYYAPVSGRAGFSQGILQTVHTTVSGVDPATGLSTAVTTAGSITDADEVRQTERRLTRLRGGNEQLMPVYSTNAGGRTMVVAYERSTDPEQTDRLGRSTNLADMLGVWRGRQQEENLALAVNQELIGKLADMWQNPGVSGRDEFVNLYDPAEQRRDLVMADAVRLIPREARQRIAGEFGKDEFWVRRDLLNNAIGYRKSSLGDSWTGNTRFSEETQRNIRNIATAAFGVKAYQYFVRGEKILENAVSDAKATIVVRSVFVPIGNIVSNMYQLAANGVPIINAVRAMPKKTAETESYIKGLIRTIEIEAEQRVAKGANDSVTQRKLSTEDRGIRDSWKRMSIWPLIEAGELNSISDTGIGKEEIDLADGKLGEYIEKLVGRLPPALKSVGRQVWISPDTALFKGLQKAVDYGDFLAKSILYDDMVQRQGKTKEEALAHITEEFVNYNYLAGRTMDKADSLGVAWFWRFKVRSVKVGLRLIRRNPVHAFLSMLVPHPPLIGSVGSPMTDNILSVLADGRIGYSIGPGQGLRAQTMNPFVNLLGI